MTSENNRVLIIGGGLAGLALGQALKNATPPIPFQIFERDTTSAYRAQGYRIRLAEGADALDRLLSKDLFATFEATCPQFTPGGSRIAAETNQPAPWNGPRGGPGQSGRAYNADRTVLRSVLMTGLEENICFGKVFESYEADEESGGVTAHFADGTSEKGAILVGADGVRSLVRKSFLPELKPLDSEGRAVFGKTLLGTPEVLEKVSSHILAGGIVVANEGGDNSPTKLFSETMRFTRGLDAAKDFVLPPDYVYWVLSFRSDHKTQEGETQNVASELTPAESAQLSLDIAAGWHKAVRAVFEKQTVESTSVLSFFICDPANFRSSWGGIRDETSTRAKQAVTLLGDSAHPMPPIGAVGANTALQEAVDLYEALVKVYHSSEDKLEQLGNYEKQIVDRAADAIGKSAGGAMMFWGMRPLAQLQPAKVWRD
ncbi:hypothetical protein H072_6923 [Dactylellina haptotyla CBS 200.50]|uniref:FAD-binding domain-containing protein n=1 Tax=Dactylellina haptotyla (strain CBS 200.50) TaxID=1284197 RepID=S8AE29_DACHA|nr:hypothetical protein H072_6923 [Dactylellina haptotyla CBS 200.50]